VGEGRGVEKNRASKSEKEGTKDGRLTQNLHQRQMDSRPSDKKDEFGKFPPERAEAVRIKRRQSHAAKEKEKKEKRECAFSRMTRRGFLLARARGETKEGKIQRALKNYAYFERGVGSRRPDTIKRRAVNPVGAQTTHEGPGEGEGGR